MGKNKQNKNSADESMMKNVVSNMKKFWRYIWYDDSFGSYIANFVVAFIFIKFMLFPSLGFILNNDYPIVAIVSGSMEHKIVDGVVCDTFNLGEDVSLNHDGWWNYCGSYYENEFDLNKEDFENYEYKNGLNIGDVIVLYGKNPSKIDVGEVLIFVPQDRNFFIQKGPVIHRVIKKWTDENGKIHFQTKGDHNSKSFNNFENDIIEDDVIGVAAVRVPYLGYAKILLNKVFLVITGRY